MLDAKKRKKLAVDLIKLTTGVLLYVIGYKTLAMEHNFVPSGMYGLSVLMNKIFPVIPLSIFNILINIPLFIIAKKSASARFFMLNLYGMLMISFLSSVINFQIHVDDTILASLAAGAIMGTGLGIVYSAAAGTGGTDIISILVNIKTGIRIGVFSFIVNSVIMGFAATQVTTDQLIASILMMFVSSVTSETALGMFNKRKEVKIISKEYKAIGDKLLAHRIGGTQFCAKGLYSKEDTVMIMVITTNFQLKYIENIVFDIDPAAIMIVDNTFNVIGRSILPRKEY